MTSLVPSPTANFEQSVEADLKRVARTIDPVLRQHCATWPLRRMIGSLRNETDAGKPVWLYGPSPWTFIPALIIAGSLAFKIGPNSLLFWGILVAIAAVSIWAEVRLVPRLAMLPLSFKLMRFERVEEGRVVFTVARWNRNSSFCTLRFQLLRPWTGKFEEGEVVAVAMRKDTVQALIRLRKEKRLSVHSIVRDVQMDAVIPPMSDRFVDLALEFAAACDSYHATADIIDRQQMIRVAKERRAPRAVEDVWSGVILNPQVKEQLIGLAEHFREGRTTACRGLLLYGPPGTGKTLIAKALADTLGCTFLSRSLSQLKAEYVGQSSSLVKDLWKQALSEDRAVIFLDECDAIFARREDADRFVQDIVNSFIAEWDGFEKQTRVWVIGATNRRETLDPAVLSRFSEQVEIALPDSEQRVAILAVELKRAGSNASLPTDTAQLTQGMAGRDLESLVGKLLRKGHDRDSIGSNELAELTIGARKTASSTTDPNARWDRLILPHQTLSDLQRTASLLRYAEQFTKQNISLPRALLLYGPPGTGKTQIARTLANETGLTFLAATTAELKGKWTGHSGNNVRSLFERARENAPALLFVDEIDLLAATRSGGDSFTAEMVGQFLQEMDGIVAHPGHVFVLAATNHLDSLDAAMLSRFPSKLEIPLPDASGRAALLSVLLDSKPLDFDLGAQLPAMVEATEGKSGRDLRSFVEQAEHKAVARAITAGDPASVRISVGDFG